MAKPPPNSMMTPHCIFNCTVCQSSSGSAGCGGVASATVQPQWLMGNWLNGIAFHRKLISQLRSVTCHMRSHSVTCPPPTQMNALCLNPSQRGWIYLPQLDLFVYFPRKDRRLSWSCYWYVPKWFTCQQTVIHPSLIATQPEVKPSTWRSQVQRSNNYCYTTKLRFRTSLQN